MDCSALRRDLLLASLLALVLGATWAWRDWANLQRLHLPDTDDVARLQQIRDWLAGQPFADLAQHRLGAGVPMHWSRLADLVPAALIGALMPFLGRHAAEVAAVTAWPVLLFAGALFLVARIARALGGGALAGTACAVAAIGYPATTLFVPGRIDHHGLQMVLLLAAVLGLLRPAGAGAGIAAGLLAAASLTIGLETAPLLAVIGAVAVTDWVLARDGAGGRLQGLGIGALAGLLLARGVFATSAWDYPACDGFTGQAWRAAIVMALAPFCMLAAERFKLRRIHGDTNHPFAGWPARAGTAALVLFGLTGVALVLSPACLRPYGGVDPVMARLWLSQVGEAQSLFAAPLATAIGYAGLMTAGIAATIWRLDATRARGWSVLLAFQLAALAITVIQLRGAYAGALLAAPGLAAVIGAARERGAIRLGAAWLASAGMLYPLAAQALTPARGTTPSTRGDCASPALLARLDRLPPGLVIAPIDAGAYILAGTRRRVLAAPYHRNGAANLAAYLFYLGDARTAAAQADRWRASYWLGCAAMPGPARAAGLPGWKAAAILPDGATIWARDGLSAAATGS